MFLYFYGYFWTFKLRKAVNAIQNTIRGTQGTCAAIEIKYIIEEILRRLK
jgi:hypothetical protein